jgi:serine/threonine protein kinase
MGSKASSPAPTSVTDQLTTRKKWLTDERTRIPEHDEMTRLFVDVVLPIVERATTVALAFEEPSHPLTRSASALLPAAPSPHQNTRRTTSTKEIRKRIDRKDSRVTDTFRNTMTQLMEVVDAFHAFRVTFAKTTVPVYRIAFVRRMFESLDALSKDLDQVVKLAALQTGPRSDGYQAWHVKLVAARDTEESELAVLAKRSTMPFARNVKGHEAMEALTLMKFEIDFFPAPRNTKKHVASMKAVFFSIVRSSNGRVTKIPDWYSPPYMIVWEDPASLPSTGLGTSNRGRWADRHHEGAVVDVVAKRLELDSEGIELFRREVEMWYSINSPYVVKLLAASHCSLPVVLVLEDAKLSTLREYTKRGSRHRHDLFAKAREAALGLQHMREKHQIVHGNLKPSNILIGADGRGKVSDFGGGMVTLQNLKIQHDKRVDLMQWRAPEFQSYRKRPTYQSDVFSLALCIVDAIVGGLKMPTAEQLVRNGLRVKGLSAEAQRLIDGMTVSDPDARTPLTEVIRRLGELADSRQNHFS